jgi:hypothetical protein
VALNCFAGWVEDRHEEKSLVRATDCDEGVRWHQMNGYHVAGVLDESARARGSKRVTVAV